MQDDYFLREWWEISLITTCPIHSVSLVDACSCGTPLTWSDVSIRGCCPEGANVPLPTAEMSSFERWFAGSVGIVKREGSPHTCLEGLNLSLSLRLFQNVGASAASGFTPHASEASQEAGEHHALVHHGFLILAGTEFENIVASSVAGFKATKSGDVPKRRFDSLGWFGDWLENEAFPDDHLFAVRVKSALEAAYGVQTEETEITDVISVARLARELGLAEEEINRRLADALGRETLHGVAKSLGIPTQVAADRLILGSKAEEIIDHPTGPVVSREIATALAAAVRRGQSFPKQLAF